MTQEDKQLLLTDLCMRLPYGVICYTEKGDGHLCSINQTIFGTEYGININPLKRDYFSDSETEEQVIKPYLRPISSLTSDECDRLFEILNINEKDGDWLKINDINILRLFTENGKDFYEIANAMDYLYSIHVDFRDMIEKGLALEAPEGMYKTK